MGGGSLWTREVAEETAAAGATSKALWPKPESDLSELEEAVAWPTLDEEAASPAEVGAFPFWPLAPPPCAAAWPGVALGAKGLLFGLSVDVEVTAMPEP